MIINDVMQIVKKKKLTFFAFLRFHKIISNFMNCNNDIILVK